MALPALLYHRVSRVLALTVGVAGSVKDDTLVGTCHAKTVQLVAI